MKDIITMKPQDNFYQGGCKDSKLGRTSSSTSIAIIYEKLKIAFDT